MAILMLCSQLPAKGCYHPAVANKQKVGLQGSSLGRKLWDMPFLQTWLQAGPQQSRAAVWMPGLSFGSRGSDILGGCILPLPVLSRVWCSASTSTSSLCALTRHSLESAGRGTMQLQHPGCSHHTALSTASYPSPQPLTSCVAPVFSQVCWAAAPEGRAQLSTSGRFVGLQPGSPRTSFPGCSLGNLPSAGAFL